VLDGRERESLLAGDTYGFKIPYRVDGDLFNRLRRRVGWLDRNRTAPRSAVWRTYATTWNLSTYNR